MKKTRNVAWVFGFLVVALCADLRSAQTSGQADWPQWRGPSRNGIAPAGPRLLDAWPKDGPTLLWKSEPIPSGVLGGCGSVTVAGGKAFVFVHHREKGAGKIIITTQMLIDLGWMEGVPDDLAKKIEEARRRKDRLTGEKLDAYIKAFVTTLDPPVAAKYADFIQARIRDDSFSWDLLTKLSRVRDKEFPTWEALANKTDDAVLFPGDDKYNEWRDGFLANGYHHTDTVICMDADTGKTLWKKEFPGALPTAGMMMYIGASSTPAVWENKCYVTGSAGFYCLSADDGSVVWKAETKFSCSSPMVYHGMVFCFIPELTAFDAATGKVIWTGDADLRSEVASVVPWSSGGKDYIIGANGDRVAHSTFIFCVDPETGKKVWTTPVNKETYSTPSIEDGFLAMPVNTNDVQGYQITPQGATRLWTVEMPDYRGASVVAYKGHVYTSAGRYFGTPLRCFDMKTGEKQWTGVGDFGSNSEGASPVIADGKVFAQIKDPDAIPARGGSTTVMYKAEPDNFELLGQFHSAAATCVSPTIANGKLYLRQTDAIACWDIADHDAQPRAESKPPRLQFQQSAGNTITFTSDGPADAEIWKDANRYSVSGANVTKVETFPSSRCVRLTTDKTWKAGENETIKYPASEDPAAKMTSLDFTAAAGRAIDDGFIREFPVGEVRQLTDRKMFEADDLEKSTRPAVGEKWKVWRKGNGQFDLKMLDPARPNLLAHAAVYVHCDGNCQVQMIIGSDSRTRGIQVVINGKVVEIANPANGNRGMQFPDVLQAVELKKGWNLIMLGLIRENYATKDWTLYVRLRDEPGTASPAGLRYSAEFPGDE